MLIENALDDIALRLARAERVLFITGAGISADSGLPTYRGVGGLYNGEHTEDGLAIEDALSGEVFALRPDITWKYLAQIEENCLPLYGLEYPQHHGAQYFHRRRSGGN